MVGYGGFGRFLHRSWSRLEDVEVVAVADSDPTAEPESLDRFATWEALIEEPSLDLIAIATPPNTHAQIACAAMEAGRHVLIEKPLATTREDAQRLIEVQARTGRRAAIDHMLRFHPFIEILQDWAVRRPFGALRRVLVENYAQDESLPPDHWFWDRSISGGILVEHAVHFIDIVQACVGPRRTSVWGRSVRRSDGRPDRVVMSVVYEGGAVMTQYHAFSRPGFFEDTSMRFVFDLAQVDVQGWIPLSGRVSALVSRTSEGELGRLSGLYDVRRVLISEARNLSHPQDGAARSRRGTDEDSVISAGLRYDVTSRIDAGFELALSKPEVYSASLNALMRDLVRGIRDPEHQLRVRLEDGLASLETALEATDAARDPIHT